MRVFGGRRRCLTKIKDMRLTKKHKEIIAYFLSLNVEEMPEGETKKLTWEIISHYRSQGVYGHCEGTFEDTTVYDDEY